MAKLAFFLHNHYDPRTFYYRILGGFSIHLQAYFRSMQYEKKDAAESCTVVQRFWGQAVLGGVPLRFVYSSRLISMSPCLLPYRAVPRTPFCFIKWRMKGKHRKRLPQILLSSTHSRLLRTISPGQRNWLVQSNATFMHLYEVELVLRDSIQNSSQVEWRPIRRRIDKLFLTLKYFGYYLTEKEDSFIFFFHTEK